MLYEVTLTLRPYWNTKSTVFLMATIRSGLATLAREYRMSAIMELHESGVPHVHALVKLENMKIKLTFCERIRTLKAGAQALFGRFSCSQVMYEQSYRQYMIKDLRQTFYLTGSEPVITDFHNLVPSDEFQGQAKDLPETEGTLMGAPSAQAPYGEGPFSGSSEAQTARLVPSKGADGTGGGPRLRSERPIKKFVRVQFGHNLFSPPNI